jgi:hypothetical protein
VKRFILQIWRLPRRFDLDISELLLPCSEPNPLLFTDPPVRHSRIGVPGQDQAPQTASLSEPHLAMGSRQLEVVPTPLDTHKELASPQRCCFDRKIHVVLAGTSGADVGHECGLAVERDHLVKNILLSSHQWPPKKIESTQASRETALQPENTFETMPDFNSMSKKELKDFKKQAIANDGSWSSRIRWSSLEIIPSPPEAYSHLIPLRAYARINPLLCQRPPTILRLPPTATDKRFYLSMPFY